jgi:hypothetical protein
MPLSKHKTNIIIKESSVSARLRSSDMFFARSMALGRSTKLRPASQAKLQNRYEPLKQRRRKTKTDVKCIGSSSNTGITYVYRSFLPYFSQKQPNTSGIAAKWSSLVKARSRQYQGKIRNHRYFVSAGTLLSKERCPSQIVKVIFIKLREMKATFEIPESPTTHMAE